MMLFNQRIEILKQSPSLANAETVELCAGTSYDDLLLLYSNYSFHSQSIWLVYGEEQTLYLSKQIAKQQSISKCLPADFRQTHFAFYRQKLGEQRKNFPSVDRKRTAWISVDGFFAGSWHDGPIVVTESNGTISNFIPTGTEASLVLAPDTTKAFGRDINETLALEGTQSQVLHRGCVAATRQKLRLCSEKLISISIPDSTLSTLVRLAILRAAMSPEQKLAILLTHTKKENSPSKVDPRLRRFCENSGTAIDTWTDPALELDSFFSWMDLKWNSDLLSVINKHGNLIPI